ncbi:CRISPR-associated endonuclease Cas2 [Suttonella ornithocola]|uniref:CRISPR-associated endoribonuclease Cas2 n=1 Tax=Suttonella ornithocola TaxID=279832 RepID=A0A380MXP9_9GAMM|nr:CRISPR-associated endonuclease Cas2 [Suttonella ornithocola]SUO97058.1 CRISPR-associated endoribonuclease Cas2 [Suttonella ornithocola]
MYYIICYDICSNKKRRLIAKALQKHGKRVQRSVFEIYIRQETELKKLTKQLKKYMGKTDSIRIYHFPENARRRSQSLDGKAIAYFPATMVV